MATSKGKGQGGKGKGTAVATPDAELPSAYARATGVKQVAIVRALCGGVYTLATLRARVLAATVDGDSAPQWSPTGPCPTPAYINVRSLAWCEAKHIGPKRGTTFTADDRIVAVALDAEGNAPADAVRIRIAAKANAVSKRSQFEYAFGIEGRPDTLDAALVAACAKVLASETLRPPATFGGE